jgi:hypothetical protein
MRTIQTDAVKKKKCINQEANEQYFTDYFYLFTKLEKNILTRNILKKKIKSKLFHRKSDTKIKPL